MILYVGDLLASLSGVTAVPGPLISLDRDLDLSQYIRPWHQRSLAQSNGGMRMKAQPETCLCLKALENISPPIANSIAMVRRGPGLRSHCLRKTRVVYASVTRRPHCTPRHNAFTPNRGRCNWNCPLLEKCDRRKPAWIRQVGKSL